MFTGSSVLITGAASGIGKAASLAFHAAGCRVVLVDMNSKALTHFCDELGERAKPIVCDVRLRTDVESAFESAINELGQIDCVFANAGVSTMNHAVDLTDEEWDFNFDVNARGIFLTNQIAVRSFLRVGNKGCIVNTASLAGKVGAPFLAHYSASKFAVIGWTQALAREVACHGIRVNAVCPGFVATSMQSREIEWEAKLTGKAPEAVRQSYIDQTPLGRLETPEDVVGAVMFLASKAAGFMTGQAINVTGGVYMT